MSRLHEHLAEEFEQAARALRAGEATVYGYRVRAEPTVRESGAVALDGRWLEFSFEQSGTTDRTDRRGAASEGAETGGTGE